MAYIQVAAGIVVALGLAIFTAIATSRTNTLLAAHAPQDAALTAGFHRALLVCDRPASRSRLCGR